jgi:GAF domain-containing protein
MSTNFPSIPAITVSAFCTPKIQKVLQAMGTLRVMDKPVDLDLLAQFVLEGLERSHQGGSINCISVGSFMQILQMEGRTCLLEVHGNEHKRGYIYMSQGDLYDATCGDLEREDAVYEMVAWDPVQLYLKDLLNGKPERRITKGIMSVVMEGLRRKDEADYEKKVHSSEPTSVNDTAESSITEALDGRLEVLDEADKTVKPEKSDGHQKSQHIDNTGKVEFIGRVFKIIHSNLRGSKLMQTLINELQDLVPVDLAVLMSRVDNKPGYLRIDEVIAGSSTTIRQGAIYSWRDSNFSEVLQHKSPLIVHRKGSLPKGIEKELFADNDIQTYFVVPLMTGDIVSGVLVLAAKQLGNVPNALQYMDWIASGFSLVAERNHLAPVVEKQKEVLDTVRQIGRALVSANVDIEKVLNFSMDKIRKIMNVEAGSLFLKENDTLKVAAAFNTNMDGIKRFRLKIGQGIAGQVAAEGKSLIVNDTRKSSQFFPGIDKYTGFKTRSILCVPLIVRKKLIGVIEVLNKINGNFMADDEAILYSLASSINVALMSARFQKQAALKAHHGRNA